MILFGDRQSAQPIFVSILYDIIAIKWLILLLDITYYLPKSRLILKGYCVYKLQ